MALSQFLCALTVMIILSSTGCQSQLPKCGLALRNTRIVGGQTASPGSWPWQVHLDFSEIGLGGGNRCAGSLISNQWVMTAAHCISGDHGKIKVYLGRHSQSGPNPNEVSRRIDQAVIHPSYDFLTNNNDICLLKLSTPVNFTDYIFPVCLASAGSTFHTGTSSWVTGWGTTANGSLSNILQEVNLPIVGNNECRCTHGGLTENMMCAGLRAGGRDACQGDSGGALVTKSVLLWVQSGIVSFGETCAKPMNPGGYTRVSRYEGWISNVTGSSKPGFVKFTSPGADSDLNFTCPTPMPKTKPTTTATTITARIFQSSPSKPPIITVTDKNGNSVFDSGENVRHFSYFTHFISLCVLVLSLFVLVEDA